MSYLKMFGSQMVEIYPEDKFVKTHIREPFFSAGKMFGWTGNTVGIGIAEEIVEFAVQNSFSICVTVGDNPNVFSMNSFAWKEFSEKHKSIHQVGDKKLLVVQWSEMKKVL